ncbi:MAG: glycosyltransferase family 4 protein [Caldilineaceae bacterium]|nr:glycosyltransferase family 4 protein [Caldilineaceae bacterium]
MKILHVNDTYDHRGGVQQYLVAVAGLLASGGHSNIIAYHRQSTHTIQDGPWPAYQVEGDDEAMLIGGLQDVAAREQPDVAYIHHVASSALVAAVAAMLPAVAYVHGFTAVCPGMAKYFRRGDQVCGRPFGWGCVPMHYLRRCSSARRPSTLARLMQSTEALRQTFLQLPRILVGSRYMADLLAQNSFSPEKITILPPHFLQNDIQLNYCPPEEPNSILYAGRLEIEKGVPYLLQALSLLPDHVRLVVAGDGTLRSQYERLSADLGLADRTEFLGWIDAEEMEHCYQRCALLVMPSICPESFGKAGVEALAHGRPVAAFAVGGIPDWMDNGVSGLLARPADATDLAGAIRELLKNHMHREMMGRNGQRIVLQRYDAYHHLNTLESVFNDLIYHYTRAS